MFDRRDQHRDPGAAHPAAAREALLAQVHRIATEHAGGYREGLTRAAALAALADLAPAPDVLAQAAAMHAVAENWYAIIAVDLLLEAGAPRHLLDAYLDSGDVHPAATPGEPARITTGEHG